MQEFIKNEQHRIQNNFIWFNTGGNTLVVFDEGKPLFKTMADSFIVTRIAPRFDAEGNHTGSDFWLLWKEVGYNNGFQYSHTIKVVKVREKDFLTADHQGAERRGWCVVELTDDRERRYRLEMIEPIQEPQEAADWKKWLAYKKSRTEKFKRIDEGILKEHLRIAEKWR